MSKTSENICLSCKELVPEEENVMTCCECDYPYHLGNCSGISESTFRSKGEAYHKSWRCPTCRIGKTRGSQIEKPKKEQCGDVANQLLSINTKLDSLLSLRDTVSGIERAIQHMSDMYDGVLERLARQESDMNEVKMKIVKLEKNETSREVSQLKQEIHELEWRSRRLNLEVHGIPQTDNEILLERINEIAVKLEVPRLSGTEVASLDRLPAKPNKVPGVIIKFTRQVVRDQWLEKKYKLKRNETSIYLQENLTRQNRALLYATKTWARENNYQYVWHKNGSILTRKRDGDRARVIRNEEDLRETV